MSYSFPYGVVLVYVWASEPLLPALSAGNKKAPCGAFLFNRAGSAVD